MANVAGKDFNINILGRDCTIKIPARFVGPFESAFLALETERLKAEISMELLGSVKVDSALVADFNSKTGLSAFMESGKGGENVKIKTSVLTMFKDGETVENAFLRMVETEKEYNAALSEIKAALPYVKALMENKAAEIKKATEGK